METESLSASLPLTMYFAWLSLALFSLSTSPIWVRIAASSAAVIGLWRLLGAALILLLIALFRGHKIWQFSNGTEAGFAGLAGVFFFLHLWTYVVSAQTTSIAHLVMIFSSAPIFTALGAALFFHESFPRRLGLIYAVAGIGIFLLFNDPLSSRASLAIPTSLNGDLSALASAFFHALYALAGKKTRKTMPNFNFSFWLYVISGLCFGALALLTPGEQLWPEHTRFYIGVAALIGLPSLLGHTLYTYLLKFMNINILSCAKLAEPGISTLIAFMMFGEEIGPRTLIAFALIGAAVLWLFLPGPPLKLRKT